MDADLAATMTDSWEDLLRLRGIEATLNGEEITAVFGEQDTVFDPEKGGFDETDVVTVLVSKAVWQGAEGARKDRLVADGITYVVHEWNRLPQHPFVTLKCKQPEA